MRGLDARLLRHAGAARTALILDAALGVVAALIVVSQAVLLARVVAGAFYGAPVRDLTLPLALLLGTVVGRSAAAWGFEVVGKRAAAGVLSSLRMGLVERRLRTRPSAMAGADGAELATTAVAGVEALEPTFTRYLPQMVLAVVVPVAVIAIVAVIDPISAAIMLVTLPLVPMFMVLVGRYTEHRTRDRWRALMILSTQFLDVVRGLPTLRAFDRSRRQAARVAEASDAYRRATMRTLRVSFLSSAVLDLAATLGIALIAVTIGVRLVSGGLGLAAGLTVLVLAPELYAPLRGLGAQYHASADGRAVVDRLLEARDDSEARPRVVRPAPGPVRIRFEGVGFAYATRSEAVLDALDFEIAPGERVRLVGPSGSGKSTLAALIIGLEHPTRGAVVAGVVDLREMDSVAWRTGIGWLPQRPTLFRGSIADNIRLGDATASDERVRFAAEAAGLDDFIRELPSGYETSVGDAGRPLSTGEIQRIGFARVLLRNAPLVILDEPTAHLDPLNADRVRDAIQRMSNDRTVLMISHQSDPDLGVDRILRLDEGRLIDEAAVVAS